jgi:hypothetical protein
MLRPSPYNFIRPRPDFSASREEIILFPLSIIDGRVNARTNDDVRIKDEYCRYKAR